MSEETQSHTEMHRFPARGGDVCRSEILSHGRRKKAARQANAALTEWIEARRGGEADPGRRRRNASAKPIELIDKNARERKTEMNDITGPITFEFTDAQIDASITLDRAIAANKAMGVPMPTMKLSVTYRRNDEFSSEGDAGVMLPECYGQDEIAEAVCKLLEHIAQESGFCVFDLLGRIGDMLPDMLSQETWEEQRKADEIAARRAMIRVVD
jgi:hypothetical protein